MGMDEWFDGCFGFLFGCLIVFALVCVGIGFLIAQF